MVSSMAPKLRLRTAAGISIAAIVTVALQLKPWVAALKTVSVELRAEQLDPLDQLVAIFGEGEMGSLKDALSTNRRTLQIQKPLIVDACEVNQLDFHKFSLWYSIQGSHRSCDHDEPANFLHRSGTRENPAFGQSGLPVGAVTLFDAIAYCHAAGGRLPSDDEWEAVGSGTNGRVFAWGNTPTAEPWREVNDHPRPCRTFPYTDTAEGVSDLATGVSEWTLRSSGPHRGSRSGGNSHRFAAQLYAYNFLHLPVPEGPSFRDPFLGFRCVYDSPVDSKARSRTAWGSVLNVRTLPTGAYPIGPPSGPMSPKLLRVFPLQQVIDRFRQALRSSKSPTQRIRVMTNEVTRAQYRQFLLDPFVRLGLYTDPQAPSAHSHVPDHWRDQLQRTDLPVNYVDWWDARAYAAWAGGRLPSADEWSRIASSSSRNPYPWGEVYRKGTACTNDSDCSTPVGLTDFRSDVTPSGLRHLGGNVSEWTNSVRQATTLVDFSVVLCGGNFRLNGADASLASFQVAVPPSYRDSTVGMRLVFGQ